MADQLISMLKTSKEIDNKWRWGKVGSMAGVDKLDSLLAFSIDKTENV